MDFIAEAVAKSSLTMFLQWRSKEDYATNAAIIMLTMAGLTIILIDHQTKSRQKRLAAALTQGFWKFTPTQVDDSKQKKLNWMKLFLAGLMISCTAMSITVKYLKLAKAFTLSVTILVGWVSFLYFSFGASSISAEKEMKDKQKADIEADAEFIGWRNKLKGVASSEDKRLPVTIVTGFLGSGKTTLVKKVLDNTVGLKVLVIENEIGAEGIDHELLLQHNDKEEIILMNNGCICCTVRKDLISTFHKMFLDSSFSKLDWVIIETTGLADPAPLIQSLYMDKECSKYLRLDSILTVVDAKHLPLHIRMTDNETIEKDSTHIDSPRDNNNKNEDLSGTRTGLHGGLLEAEMQIIFSDRIIINKIDLVSAENLEILKNAIKKLNPGVQIICCEYSDVPVQDLLNIRAFDPFRNSALLLKNLNDSITDEEINENLFDSVGDKIENGSAPVIEENDRRNVATSGFIQYNKYGHIISRNIKINTTISGNSNTDSVSTVSLTTEKPLNLDLFNLWVSALLRVEGANIFRLKGILNMHGYDNQFVVQGVHMIFDGEMGPKWNDSLTHNHDVDNTSNNGEHKHVDVISRMSRLVLIGKGLNRNNLKVSFLACERTKEDDEA